MIAPSFQKRRLAAVAAAGIAALFVTALADRKSVV